MIRLIFLLFGLSGCAPGPEKPWVPDGTERVPVNQAGQKVSTLSRVRGVVAEPNKGNASSEAPLAVSLQRTIRKIADNTGLRFLESDLDELVQISPGDDPFDVLKQLAAASKYRVSLDRNKGVIWVSNEPKKTGLWILRETHPVSQIGEPVPLKPMPEKAVGLIEAMKLLAPDGFEIGISRALDPNVRVNLGRATTWVDALEMVALETPYRLVVDWQKRMIYAVPVVRKWRVGNAK